MRNRYRSGFHPRTNKNRAGFTRESCVKGGSACRGYETAEDAWQRDLIDAKGLLLRHGVTYSAKHPNGKAWEKRRAIGGRVDQIEIVLDGKIYRTTGESRLTGKLGWFRGRNPPPLRACHLPQKAVRSTTMTGTVNRRGETHGDR